MTRDIISPRTIGVVLVALLGVTILASISAPAVQATNDSEVAFQQDGVADCSRCHEGTKGSGLNPKMCGECHTEAYEDWQQSGHAESLSEGAKKTRIISDEQCAECHVENDIKRRDDIDFQTKAIEVGKPDEPITCEACHAPPELGWFAHFGKGGDMLEPAGTGPHGSEDAQVSPPQEVCTACHGNDVVLQLANESKISPHETALVGSVDGGTNDGVEPTTTTTTTTQTTQAPVPGFGILAALAALLGAVLLGRRYG